MINPADETNEFPVVATTHVNGAGDLVYARQLVTDAAAIAGLDPNRVERLALAVSEAATNAITHGTRPATVTITTTATTFTVAVRDHGPGLTSPPVSALPQPTEPHGRGLWLAEQLCDLVEINSSANGTTVRLTMSR